MCLSIGLIAALSLNAHSQAPAKSSGSTKKDAAAPKEKEAPAPKDAEKSKDAPPADAEKADEDKGETAASESTKEHAIEVFKDPKAVEALSKKYQPLAGVTPTIQVRKLVAEMAGGAPINRDTLSKFIAGLAADLTNPSYIRAIVEDGKPVSQSAKVGIRDAVRYLLDPIDIAKRGNNQEFLNSYSQELLKVLPRILENHPISRLQAIIVLGQTGSPDAINVYTQQLNDKNQLVWVKLWAARGITNIVQTGAGGNRVDEVLSGRAIPAAKALSNFLNREAEIPWPVQVRALEALGALRLAADPAAAGKVEMADAVVHQLANREAKPEVRAQAAWSLGMMRLNSGVVQFNYPLVAYFIGDVAATVGEKVANSYEENITLAQYWTSVLVYQVFPAFYGQEGARDSGLMKIPAVAQNRAVKEIAELVKPLVKTSVDLINSPKGTQAQVAKDLTERVGQLRAYLEKNPPSNTFLVPQGTQYPVKADVAGAQGQPAKVAAGAGAR
ncbi:HEAT repeat domain-containing protein [Singulisphaera sp. PoT]|uniref:HEAT repeat domain-containing protein n=1 Tax=Singulisphaera sp. PoT TaxID=3411797 RepID=UPI003BF51679